MESSKRIMLTADSLRRRHMQSCDQEDCPTLLDGNSDDLPIPALEPGANITTMPPIIHRPAESPVRRSRRAVSNPAALKKPVPWDGKINWTLKTCSAFNNSEEEYTVLLKFSNGYIIPPNRCLSKLGSFQYGLRYFPGTDGNAYRTVKIENLPLETTMDKLLPKVQGGRIYSAQLLNTRRITGYHTAIVIFVLQRDAQHFLEHVSKFGFWVGHTKAGVSLVNTPTYPMPTEMQRLVFGEAHTRCLAISNLDESLMSELCRVLLKSCCHDYIERVEEEYDGVCVRFHCIKMASLAFELVKDNPRFARCKLKFVRDPCSIERVEKPDT